MTFPSDLEIARSAKLRPLADVAADAGIPNEYLEPYGDGTAKIKILETKTCFADLTFTCGTGLLEEMVEKGSVAVDGISLTAARMQADGFSVAVIPQTLRTTTLGQAKIGDIVNIETDIIIKSVKSQLKKILPQKSSLSVDALRELGF